MAKEAEMNSVPIKTHDRTLVRKSTLFPKRKNKVKKCPKQTNLKKKSIRD